MRNDECGEAVENDLSFALAPSRVSAFRIPLTVTDFGEGDWRIPTGLVPVDDGFDDYQRAFRPAPPPYLAPAERRFEWRRS